MEPIQTQHHPCLQKNAPHTPTLPPHAVCTLSFQIAPAFSIPRLNSEQIAIISRYILSLPLLRNLLLFLRRRIVVHLSLSLSLSLSLFPSFLLMAHSTSGETKDLTNGVYRPRPPSPPFLKQFLIWNFAESSE